MVDSVQSPRKTAALSGVAAVTAGAAACALTPVGTAEITISAHHAALTTYDGARSRITNTSTDGGPCSSQHLRREIVDREVIAKHQKALLIFGGTP